MLVILRFLYEYGLLATFGALSAQPLVIPRRVRQALLGRGIRKLEPKIHRLFPCGATC